MKFNEKWKLRQMIHKQNSLWYERRLIIIEFDIKTSHGTFLMGLVFVTFFRVIFPWYFYHWCFWGVVKNFCSWSSYCLLNYLKWSCVASRNCRFLGMWSEKFSHSFCWIYFSVIIYFKWHGLILANFECHFNPNVGWEGRRVILPPPLLIFL